MDVLEVHDKREDSFEPYEKMEFLSQKAAYDFYNTYGYISGFSIRMQTFYKNAKGVVTSIRLVCSKEGFNKRKNQQLEEPLEIAEVSIEKTPQKITSMKRGGCKAACQVRLHKDGIWRITSLQKDHNHPLINSTPSKKRHLRSHKQISMEDKVDIELLSEQNVGGKQIREYLAAKAGGKENLHFSKKDVNNQIASVRRNLVGVDVNAMIDFFKRRQQTDAEFVFAIEPDEDGVAKNIFWVDGRSRRAYREFGDVIVFDTTYSTNKYSMPFAPFVGVNHHKQSIFFGCALIRDEKKTTFSWLFNMWLEVMGGKKPQTIFTDQDPAMKAAIETVFGRDTVHRCCLWHVMKNARDHLGVLYGSVEGFREELGAVIDFSWTIVDFETNWLAILKKYKMEGNSYLTLMFDKRDEWAPAYYREVFCAGMSTTQRSESMNAVTKIWMGSNTSLYDFATKFEKMVEGVYERESDEDIRTMNETPQLWSCHPVEAEARKVYTRSIFSLLRDNWKRSTALDVHEVEKEKLYEVRHVTKQSKYEWYKSNHMVLVDQINGRADCECKGFLNERLLCSHALEVMRQVKMRPFLPPYYILRRWTRDANASTKRGVNEHELEGKDLQSVMHNALTKRLDIIVNKGSKSRASYDIACTILDELDERLTETNEEIAEVELSTNLNTSAEENIKDSLTFCDPLVSQCKGKRKPQRFKSPVEIKAAKKMRTCSICHKKEGHNMRNCPMRKKDGQARGTVSHNHEEDSEFESENDVL